MVRIRLPPAKSLQTIGSASARLSWPSDRAALLRFSRLRGVEFPVALFDAASPLQSKFEFLPAIGDAISAGGSRWAGQRSQIAADRGARRACRAGRRDEDSCEGIAIHGTGTRGAGRRGMFLTALLCGEIVDLPGGGVRHSNRESARAGAATNNRDSYFSRGRIGQLLDIYDRRRDRPYSETGADDPLSDRAPTFYAKVHFRHHVGFPIDIRNADAHYQGKPGLARDTRTCCGSMPSCAAPSRSGAMGGAVARAKATATWNLPSCASSVSRRCLSRRVAGLSDHSPLIVELAV